jgi:hypothetical protein
MDTLDQFVDYLKTNDLIIAPRDLVENHLEVRTAKDVIKRKRYASFKELSDAQIFGNITPQAVKAFLKKYANEDDLIKLKKGSIDVWKLRTKAIEPLQNLRL